MTAQRVHSVLAAGLTDPSLLLAWLAQPERLRAHGVEPSTVDLQTLRKFAGLAVKIRYNPCRLALQATFRWLSLAQLEIEMFSAFAQRAEHERRQGRKATHEKLDALVAHVSTWRDPTNDAHALLFDLIRHEQSVFRLQGLAQAASTPARELKHARGARRLRPSVHAGVILQRMRFDPRPVVAALLAPTAPESLLAADFLRERPPAALRLAYRVTKGTVSILELDELAFTLLELLDGATTIPSIAVGLQSQGINVSPALLQAMVARLDAMGLLQAGGAA